MGWIMMVMLSLLLWMAPPTWADTVASVGFEKAPIAYESLGYASDDGIGKRYLGREIANVIGHRGAYWLERSSRALEERPDLLIKALDLKPEMVVGDIGAGTGYFSAPMARRLDEGRVYAVDIQPEMLALMERYKAESGIENVELVLSTESDPKLPESVLDLALMVDAYHEFEYPYEMMQGIVTALKPGGLAVLAEYRGEDRLSTIKPHHKMSQRQAKKEMAAVGLDWVKTNESLPEQHLMFFQKP